MSEGATIILTHLRSFTRGWGEGVESGVSYFSLRSRSHSAFPSRNKSSFVVKHLPPHGVNALVGDINIFVK